MATIWHYLVFIDIIYIIHLADNKKIVLWFKSFWSLFVMLDVFRIFFPNITSYSGAACVDFYYSMYGYHINTLRLVQITQTSTIILFMRYKDMGDAWRHGFVDVVLNTNSRVSVKYCCYSNYNGCKLTQW